MSDLTIPKSDYGYNLAFTVQESDGSVYDLTDYTITFKVWYKHASGNPIVSASCTPDDAPNGTCHYTVQQNDFIKVGDYLLELELTKTGIIESTRFYTLRVEESP